MRMKSVLSIVVLLWMAILVPLSVSGQNNGPTGASATQGQSTSSAGSPDGGEGIDASGYHINQSITLGYRFTRTNGNTNFFDNLVNVQQGPRVLDQVLSMRSLTNSGTFFDNLYISSFGWGGDPYNAARWTVSKAKAYNFTGNFRRDKNFFDYDLLANPLNPVPAASTLPAGFTTSINNSPHLMATTRRMSDLALTILPQAAVSIRLGYARNNMTGPSFSTFHQGTEALLFQNWITTSNQYHIGLDFKVLPKTIISYDQFLNYFDNKTDLSLAPFAVFNTATGVPVSFGLPWPPCNAPFTSVNPPVANPACNGFQSYNRNQHFHYNQPTEQLMVQTRALKRVDFVVLGRYSSNDNNNFLNEEFLGVETRTNTRALTFTGPTTGRRLITDFDLSATIHLNDTWRIPVTYRFYNSRIGGSFDSLETIFAPTTPAVFGGPLGVGVPTADLVQTFLGIKRHDLQAEIEHDFTKSFGARLGFRYGRRNYHVRNFEEPDPDITQINDYTGLFGLWYRSNAGLRANLDVELSSADNFLVRISPRNQQRYRARVSYTPKPWAVASIYGNVWDGHNSTDDIRYRLRTRAIGFDLNLTPNEKYGVDLAYNFNLWAQDSNICFVGTFSPPGTSPITDPADPCATAESGALTSRVLGAYDDHVHYGNIAFYVRPVKRFTANVGYAVTSSDGTSTFLNVLQPFGPLSSTYHQPLLNLAYQVHQNVTFNAGYNYYNYNEGKPGSALVALPRNFRANVTTLSLKYAF